MTSDAILDVDTLEDELPVIENSIDHKIIFLEKKQIKLKNLLDILLFAESCITGLYAGISSVATKFLIEVLRETEDTRSQNIGLTLSVTLLLLSLIFNMTTMNHLLSLFPSLKAVPSSQSMIIIGTIISGGIMLDEFSAYSAVGLFIFSIGAMICVIGLYLKIFI